MRDLVEFLARSLVDHPDQISVEEFERDHATVLELHVSPDDLGKVIGRQGRTARAMRTVLAAAGSRARRRYVLEIAEKSHVDVGARTHVDLRWIGVICQGGRAQSCRGATLARTTSWLVTPGTAAMLTRNRRARATLRSGARGYCATCAGI
jgi:predicted RNA-binding protein YlqC (UPF0109 family)